jgi:hypothetical protein
MKKSLVLLLMLLLLGAVGLSGRARLAAAATPGGIFVTGHDPDYHAYRGGNTTGSQHILQKAVNYVTFGKASPRMLLVTSLVNPGGDQSDSRLGLTAAGYTYDVATAGGGSGALALETVNLSTYDVVVVASDYGGWLRQQELDVLNARAGAVLAFINAGGGIVALSEAGNRGNGTGTTHDRFKFLPFIVSEVPLSQSEFGNTVTAAGAAMGLGNSDINGNASHSVFHAATGMDVIDLDAAGRILSQATRGKFIGTDGPCTADHPSVGWNSPLNATAAYNMAAGSALPISFRWGTCDSFLHDESVIVLVVDQAAPDFPVTAYVYGYDILIDDGHQSYSVTFDSSWYGVAAGSNLEVQVYIGGALAGTAPVHVN